MRSLLILLIPAFFSGCSLRTAAVRTAADVMQGGAIATQEEPDLALGREALGSQLKLIEGLLVSDPANKTLHLLAAEGFGAYAFLFLEETEPERAKAFYLRGRDHARAAGGTIPAKFWEAFGWAGAINLSRDSSEALAELPKAVDLMTQVSLANKEFQYAGSDLFFGTYYASRPAMLGGDKNKAKSHFEWARRITGGKYLMTYVLEARYLAVALQDKALYEQLLKRVIEAPAGQLPGARLTDEAAKKRAVSLLEKADDYF